jgi:hypothetical protein
MDKQGILLALGKYLSFLFDVHVLAALRKAGFLFIVQLFH